MNEPLCIYGKSGQGCLFFHEFFDRETLTVEYECWRGLAPLCGGACHWTPSPPKEEKEKEKEERK